MEPRLTEALRRHTPRHTVRKMSNDQHEDHRHLARYDR